MNNTALFQEFHQVLNRGYTYNYLWIKRGEDKQTVWVNGTMPPLPTDADVYFGVYCASQTMKRTGYHRPKLNEIVAMNCLHSEFDCEPDEKLATLTYIEALEYPPNVIIDSVGGYHCYWSFTDTLPITAATRDDFRQALYGWVDLTGGDKNAKDLCRILRVPGTYNQKPEHEGKDREVKFVRADLGYFYDGRKLLRLGFDHYTAARKVELQTRGEARVNLQTSEGIDKPRLEAYVNAIIKSVHEVGNESPDGHNRTKAMYNKAMALGNVVGAELLSFMDAESLLLLECQKNGLLQEDGERSIAKQISNGLNYGMQTPLDTSRFMLIRPYAHALDLSEPPHDTPNPSELATHPVLTTPESEKALLGVILQNGMCLDDILEKHLLTPAHFYYSRHQIIYRAILATAQHATPDLISVRDTLRAAKWHDKVGGDGYLGELTETGQIEALEAYIARVKSAYIKRQLASAAKVLEQMAGDDSLDDATAISRAQSLTREIEIPRVKSGGTLMEANTSLQLELLDGLYGKPYGFSSGYRAIDSFGKILPKTLTVIAARPGVGKSALMLNIAYRLAKAGKKVGYVSLEMPKEDVSARLASVEKKLDYKALVQREVTQAQYNTYMSYMQAAPIMAIHDTPNQSVDEIIAWARIEKLERGLDALFVDYLTIIRILGDKANHLALGDIGVALRNFAIEYDLAVYTAMQLNRDCEKRLDKRPVLSDLGESDSPSHDADRVWMLYRDNYYDPENPDLTMEVLVRKNRKGDLGTARLIYDLKTQAMYDRQVE